MPPRLVALGEGSDIALTRPIVLIGRHQECDIQIPSRKISRRHCCLAQVGERLLVRDLGSTNGVRINGTRVLEGSLGAGDELTLGNLRYEFRCIDDAHTQGVRAGVPRLAVDGTIQAEMVSGEFPMPLDEIPGLGAIPAARPAPDGMPPISIKLPEPGKFLPVDSSER